MADAYYSLIIDDDDYDDYDDYDGGIGGIGGIGDGGLDTQWITVYENNILFSEYELFLKSDITRVSFRFIYLDRNKKCVEFVVPTAAAESYTLQCANQITQSELFQIIYRHQNVTTATKKKYYNFHSLLLYDFQLEEENNDNFIRSVAEYISSPADVDFGRVIEYTNILSFETIYFKPLSTMFHDLIEFTVILYED
jgi:hypothetical protein